MDRFCTLMCVRNAFCFRSDGDLIPSSGYDVNRHAELTRNVNPVTDSVTLRGPQDPRGLRYKYRTIFPAEIPPRRVKTH
jgi:hypothetical protein